MRTGLIQSHLPTLNEEAQLVQVDELVDRKLHHPEKSSLPNVEMDFHRREFDRLLLCLEEAAVQSSLPETATVADAMDRLLIDLRLSCLPD